ITSVLARRSRSSSTAARSRAARGHTPFSAAENGVCPHLSVSPFISHLSRVAVLHTSREVLRVVLWIQRDARSVAARRYVRLVLAVVLYEGVAQHLGHALGERGARFAPGGELDRD